MSKYALITATNWFHRHQRDSHTHHHRRNVFSETSGTPEIANALAPLVSSAHRPPSTSTITLFALVGTIISAFTVGGIMFGATKIGAR